MENNQSALTQYKLAKPEAAPSLASGRFRTWTARCRSGRTRPDKKAKCWGVSTGEDGVVGHEENLASSKVRRSRGLS